MKQFINLTNHPINIITPEGIKTIKPSGQIARVNYKIKEIDNVDGVPIVEIQYGEIIGLPEPKKDTYYIVSSVVKNAVGLNRKDVVTLYDVKRKNGEPYACGGFRING
jgi:hypothetical protein